MKRVSIQDLKAGLSAAVAVAAQGGTVLITKHGRPVAELGPARPDGVHRGRRVGQGAARSAGVRSTDGRYLAVLLEDRGTR